MQQRYLALDVFRGMTICLMIIVNSPGSWTDIYGPLEHATWHGFTPTDFVFPAFLFAVGNAMAFSMVKFQSEGDAVFWKKVIKRTLLIFLIGFLMYWFPFFERSGDGWMISPLSQTRIPGVLQRIALCYFLAAVLIHFLSINKALIISAIVLILYWIVMYVFGEGQDPFSLTDNAALSLDLWLIGPNHMYHGEGIAFDPEGLLSTFPAVVNVVGGYWAGMLIREKGNSFETIARLLLVAIALIGLALIWDMTFPINKKIWTSSFVLLTVGISMALLACLVYAIEIKKLVLGTYFFSVFGKNPLFIYVLSSLLLSTWSMIQINENENLRQWLYTDLFGSFASPLNASLFFALFYMLICWLVGYLLDKRKIYIKV